MNQGNYDLHYFSDKMERTSKAIDYIRTPIGSFGGTLAPVRTDDLAVIVLKELLKRNPHVDFTQVGDVILGCANQAGEDNRNVARMASLMAGLPINVPGETVNRLCASGLSATVAAARAKEEGIIPKDEKATYAGRLDPMAEGLLIVLTGESVHKKAYFS